MRILKIIGVGIFYFIGIVIFATIMALGTMFTYFYLQMLLFGRGDYLLFVSSSNTIPVIMIMILIVYVFIQIKGKIFKNKEKQIEIIEEDDEYVDIETLGKLEKLIFKILNRLVAPDDVITKIFKATKICYILVLIIAIYCGMTSYEILYTDSIKVSSPIKPTGVIYNYSDVKSIDVGVERDGRNYYFPYYNVIFYDNRSVNLISESIHEDKGKGFEYILIDLDKKLGTQGVSKSISKVNFEEYSRGLDKDFISRMKKLFDDK